MNRMCSLDGKQLGKGRCPGFVYYLNSISLNVYVDNKNRNGAEKTLLSFYIVISKVTYLKCAIGKNSINRGQDSI